VFTDAVHDVTSLFRGQWLPGAEDPNASLFLQGRSVPSRAHRDRFPLDGDLERVAGNELQCVTERLGKDETPRLVERGFHEYQFTMGNAIWQMALFGDRHFSGSTRAGSCLGIEHDGGSALGDFGLG